MPDEQYYALANLVKRPMRRWWAKVGSWWLVGLGVLLVAQLWQVGIEVHTMQTGSFLEQGDVTRQVWFQLIRILSNTSLIISVGVALLCATNVIALIDRTTYETLAFSEAQIRVYKYKLALLNCWPVLVPIFLRVFIYFIWMLSRQFGEINSVWLLVMPSLEIVLPLFILVIWLVAFSVVAKESQWQVWTILMCSQAPLTLVMLNESGIFPPLSKVFPPLSRLEFSELEEAVIKGIGLIIIYFLFYLFLVGKTKTSAILCFIYSIILLVPNSLGFFSIYAIANLKMAGLLTESCTQPVSLSYSPYNSNFNILIGSFSWYFPAGQAWAIVPVLNGIFWLFAHYFAFSWLMGRNWRARKSDS